METITAKERAKLILFNNYDYNNFIRLVDHKTKQENYLIIGK